MPTLEVKTKKSRTNVFKISSACYFKHFFEDRELFRELAPFYEKPRYKFKMTTVGKRSKVMKLLDMKGYDPTIIEDPSPYTVEIARYQKISELLKNSIVMKMHSFISFGEIF